MRLVLQREGAAEAGLKRYDGRGVLSSIGRKILLSGLKRVTKAEERKEYPHKFVDFVVNGSRKRKKVVKPKTIEEKSSLHSSKKYSPNITNQLINSGSGIVLD
jgi:hypothetical protein